MMATQLQAAARRLSDAAMTMRRHGDHGGMERPHDVVNHLFGVGP